VVNLKDTDHLLEQAAGGDQEAWGTLLARHRQRLHSLIALRMDRRLQGLIDPSDVKRPEASPRDMPLPDWLGFQVLFPEAEALRQTPAKARPAKDM